MAIRYLLQGSRDPSLILPASEAWNLKAQGASALGKDAGAVREYLLASLGQAAGIYPPIEASLRERTPEGCSVDVIGAHEFLRGTASALEQSGFGVMLARAGGPASGPKTRLKARAQRQESASCRAERGCRSNRSLNSTGRSPWATRHHHRPS